MSLFRDAFKALDEIGQEVNRHAGYAAADVSRAAEGIEQEALKRIDPSTLEALRNFGKDAGEHVGATADDICKALLGAGHEVGKHTDPILKEIRKPIGESGQGVKEYLIKALEDSSTIEWERLPEYIKDWITNHPAQTIIIILSIVAVPLANTAVLTILKTIGFRAEGVAAGSIAASIQSGIGDVAAGSLFATLMSAGAGGAGLLAVQIVVESLTGIAAASAVISALMGASKEAEEHAEKSEQ